ncbi:pentapeptide repeat-containing protein [Streptomyces sp. NPDC005271]|uniref:pentapeptide repeat-containing protein n=1 Tax=unclassified Streptomyces TaxID=2593676 RepID=UPI0033B6A7B1
MHRAALRAPGSSPVLVPVVSRGVRDGLLSRIGAHWAPWFVPPAEEDEAARGDAFLFAHELRLLRLAVSDPFSVPTWPHCGFEASSDDPVGCRGIRVPGHHDCLRHPAPSERAAYLSGLRAGDAIDVSGTEFTAEALEELLDALREPVSGTARFGAARFTETVFAERISFARARFSEPAGFDHAVFTDGASFAKSRFSKGATFDHAVFHGNTTFTGAVFSEESGFDHATFHGVAEFDGTRFTGRASLRHTTFHGDTSFDDAILGPSAFDHMTVHSFGSTASTGAFSGCAALTIICQAVATKCGGGGPALGERGPHPAVGMGEHGLCHFAGRCSAPKKPVHERRPWPRQ